MITIHLYERDDRTSPWEWIHATEKLNTEDTLAFCENYVTNENRFATFSRREGRTVKVEYLPF